MASPNPEPARIIFVSSVAVLQSEIHITVHLPTLYVRLIRSPVTGRPATQEVAPEETIEDPSFSIGNGYGESKWVAETILNIAGKKTTLRPVNVRVGQICGNRTGYWNEREWVPSLVKTALYQKCLPDAAGVSGMHLQRRSI